MNDFLCLGNEGCSICCVTCSDSVQSHCDVAGNIYVIVLILCYNLLHIVVDTGNDLH
jgi:hypothetical protein